MNGPFVLKNYKYRNAVLNLTVSGKGDTLESITVNGEEKPLVMYCRRMHQVPMKS